MSLEIENIETALPAVITKVNGDGTVDCRTSIRKVLPNGVFDLENAPIQGIPLMKLGGASAEFTFPSREGDHVLLIAFSRDSGKWRTEADDGDVVPDSATGLSLMDLVAIPFVKAPREASARVCVNEDGDILFTPAEGRRTICDSDLLCRGSVLSTGEVAAKVVEVGDTIDETLAAHLSTHIHQSGVGPTTAPQPGT